MKGSTMNAVTSTEGKPRVAFQGAHGAFSEDAAVKLLGENIDLVPRATFEATFSAIDESAAEAAVKRAQEALRGEHLGAEEVAAVQASLQKSLAQLHVKRRHH